MEILTSEPAAYAAIHHAVKPARAQVLPAGVAILEAILERYGRDRISVVDTGVREGGRPRRDEERCVMAARSRDPRPRLGALSGS